MMPIHRVALFKVYSEEGMQTILDKYSTLKVDCKKNGKPYIKDIVAGKTQASPMNGGFNLAVNITFASKEDMNYYDSEDQAHKALLQVVDTKADRPTVVTF